VNGGSKEPAHSLSNIMIEAPETEPGDSKGSECFEWGYECCTLSSNWKKFT